MRVLNYADAIREAHAQLLEHDPRVFVLGQGLWSPWYVGNSMTDLDKRFGRERVIDTPVSELATTGAALSETTVSARLHRSSGALDDLRRFRHHQAWRPHDFGMSGNGIADDRQCAHPRAGGTQC